MNNKQSALLLKWRSFHLYNIVILVVFFLFYSIGSLQSYSFFAPPAAFNISLIYPFSAILLCAYLIHCMLTKKEQRTFILLPVLTLFCTLFLTINSHFEAQTSQNSFLYCTLLLPFFYSYLLAYNFKLLLLNNLIIVFSYAFTAVVGDTSALVFTFNAIILATLIFLTLFPYIKKEEHSSEQTELEANSNYATNKQSAQYLKQLIHDVRQPLSSLNLYSHLLEKQLKETPQQEIVENLMRSSAQLETWLSNLFEKSALDAKSIHPKLENINLSTALAPLIKKYQYQTKQRGLTLRVRITNQTINCDIKLLNDILERLLNNALIHGAQSAGGTILLSARKFNNQIKLQVWNQGKAIGNEQIKTLFDEENYAKNARQNKAKGLGLGLSIAQRKAQLLGSEITVKSSTKGSCFSFNVQQGDKRITNLFRDTISKGNEEHILLVDDDLSILNALSLLLENWGYQVTCAENYQQALSLLNKYTFALVISDFRLPNNENGIDLISTAQQKQKVAALLLTGEVDPDRLKKGKAVNYKILHKPIKPAALRLLLRQLL